VIANRPVQMAREPFTSEPTTSTSEERRKQSNEAMGGGRGGRNFGCPALG
jgi:hypothetical protein